MTLAIGINAGAYDADGVELISPASSTWSAP
jgi:hypothetical protein